MKKISVVIPMYCEEEVVDICYKRVVNNLDVYKRQQLILCF